MNDSIEEILKEYEARHEGHIPDECCVDFVWLEPKLHALVEKTRADTKREMVAEMREAFLERGKEQGGDTILWNAKQIVEVMDKILTHLSTEEKVV